MWAAWLLIGGLLPRAAYAIYEDQVGQLDWRRDHVGIPLFASFEAKKLYVATDQGVLAALNARTGSIEWRRHFSSPSSSAVAVAGAGTEATGNQQHVIDFMQPFTLAAGSTFDAAPSSQLLTVTHGGSKVSLWRSGDGALIWDAKTTSTGSDAGGVSSTSTAAAPAAAAAAAATELEHGKLFAVLARNGVSAYASASGALAWSLDASQLSGLASSSSSGSGGAAIQWSDIVAAASGKNGQGGASGACIVGLSSSSSSNGKLAVVDLKRSSNGKGGDQGGFTVDVRGKSSSSSSLALPRRGEWSDDRASALVVLAETSGAAVLVYDVSGLFGSESASSSANANAASRWKRLALDKVLLEGEEASGPAVPLPGGGNSLWQLPLTSGATVAFALFQAPSSSSSSTSSGSSSSGAAAAVRVASAKKGGSIGAVVLPSSGAEAGGGSTSGSSASAQQRLFVSTVANTADVSSAAAAAPAPAAAVAQLFEVTSGGTVKEVEDASPAQGPTDWDASSHGAFLLGACFPHVVLKRDGGVAFRALAATQGDSLLMLTKEPASSWVREEALAAVEQVVFVAHSRDLHGATSTSSHEALIPSWPERLAMQRQDLQEMLTSLTSLVTGGSGKGGLGDRSKDGLTPSQRHKFGLDKLAVCLTRSGRVLALGLESGEVVWSILLPQKGEFYKLLATRPFPAGAYRPEVALLHTSPQSAATLNQDVSPVTLLDASSGRRVTAQSSSSSSSVAPLAAVYDTVALPDEARDNSGRTGVLVTGWSHKNKEQQGNDANTNEAEATACLLLPNAAAETAVLQAGRPFFFHLVHPQTGLVESRVITGRATSTSSGSGTSGGSSELGTCFTSSIVGQSMLAEAVPSSSSSEMAADVSSSSSSSLVAVAYPQAADVSNAPAQILGDDSLLLKYRNSHLMAAMTFSPDDQSLQVSLVDTVAGRVLHRVTHTNAAPSATYQQYPSLNSTSTSAPVQKHQLNGCLVLTENWVAYSYWNTKAKRSELGVLALFEGMMGPLDLNPFKVPLQDASFSSFSAKPPVVMQRTFVLPHAVTHLEATVTAQGIATKDLLATFESGQVAMLNRRMLDPRRPNDPPSKVEQAEGLMQYHPFLFVDPRAYLTMNTTVTGLRSVFVHPAVIESTTLVLAVGVDLFYTRATPSKTFDLLAADFNHPFLVLLLLGLGAAVVALRRLDHEKKLQAAWQ